MSSLYVNNDGTYLTTGNLTTGNSTSPAIKCTGDIVASGFKIHKDANKFYEYTLRVVALKELPTPDHTRLLLSVTGTAELGPKAVLRDYVLLKHGAEISALGAVEELTIEVNVLRCWDIV